MMKSKKKHPTSKAIKVAIAAPTTPKTGIRETLNTKFDTRIAPKNKH